MFIILSQFIRVFAAGLTRFAAGLTCYDILENCSETVQVQEDGTAEFPVAERSVSVWVAQDTEGQ